MRFSAEWLENGDRSAPELLATACQLAIEVGGLRVTQFADHRHNTIAERVVMPAYPLADGLARHWWSLMAGRTGEVEVRLKTFREGFAVPDIRFAPDGIAVLVTAQPVKYANPPVHFFEEAKELAPLGDFERDIRHFIENVIARLETRSAANTNLVQRWEWIQRSFEDDEERGFCEAAGALGVDPYSCGDEVAAAIEKSADWFAPDALGEFLAGEHHHVENVLPDIGWIATQEQRLGEHASFHELPDWSAEVRRTLRPQAANKAWRIGYDAARETRRVLSLDTHHVFESAAALAERFGAHDFRIASERTRGLRACASYHEAAPRVLVSNFPGESLALFALARAAGDLVVYAQPGRSPIVATYSHRQAVGRAYAAELLAPAEVVAEMVEDRFTVEEIAEERHVSPMVIEHQLENHSPHLLNAARS